MAYSKEGILSHLKGYERKCDPDITKTIQFYDYIDSTNRRIKEIADEGAKEGFTLVADCQMNGRGRRGRAFVSPKGKGVYLSYLLRPTHISPKTTSKVTAWTAVAVRRAIKNACGIDTQIKWVNDIVINKKKLGGILSEIMINPKDGSISYIAIGIGINVNQTAEELSDEIKDIATSLLIETGKEFDKALLCAEIIKSLDQMCNDFPEHIDDYFQEYADNCITTGNKIKIITPVDEKVAYALSINEDFGLTVRMDDGSDTTLYSGEVSVRGFYNYI